MKVTDIERAFERPAEQRRARREAEDRDARRDEGVEARRPGAA